MIDVVTAATAEDAAALAAQALAGALGAALAERPIASLVVTGGRAPRAVLPRLAAAGLPWDRIIVTLTDERWVAISDPASNEGQARALLPPGVRLVGLKTAHLRPVEALAEVEARLAGLPRPFDAVFLALGDDGHVASLFPGAPTTTGLVAAATAPDGMARISLTVDALLASRLVVLPVLDPAKAPMLARALAPGPAGRLPARAILHQDKVPVRIVTVAG